jgi:hypothetical protein
LFVDVYFSTDVFPSMSSFSSSDDVVSMLLIWTTLNKGASLPRLQFIGFRDEAATLKGKNALLLVCFMLLPRILRLLMRILYPLLFSFSKALRRAEERADALEGKLKASETTRKKAKKDAAAAESLRHRLKTAEDALRDKEV